jgi:two-component system, OmpR family, phosphate regulon sensor histidine kinase PhoR
MKKTYFRLLLFFMSVSLIGIILVQIYWFNTSFNNNEEQFKFHIQQVIGNVANNLQKIEASNFINKYEKLKDSTGRIPKKSDLLQFCYVKKNGTTNETIIYSNSIIAEDYKLSSNVFGKSQDDKLIKSYTAKRKTEIYSGNNFDNSIGQKQFGADVKIEKTGELEILRNASFEIFYKDIASVLPIEERISKENLQKILYAELSQYGVKTPFEFGIYSNGIPTKVKSDLFKYDEYGTYSIPVFGDSDGNKKYQLLVSFPCKKRYLFSELIAISSLTIIFTLIIILAYASALSQLVKQRQISEIKTDFINNMTHEFKTPIATINLALDAIKNPKVIDDKEKVFRYLQMIRDENKRMHAQVENVLRISKLDKKELEINKESFDIHQIIEHAIEHVNLIIEDRNGKINTKLAANRTSALINDVHFTNIIVNILDNAIKYATKNPVIEIITENVNDFIIIKIKDNGIGMSKIVQKRIFEKFYREHTGNIHNVKGHGLGLAYVKRIIEDHNCEISVESEKGYGSTFIIKIPLIN